MNAVSIVGLLVYTFGAFAYAGLLAISLQVDGREDSHSTADPKVDRTARVGLTLWTVCFLWFVVNLVIGLAELGPYRGIWQLGMAALWLSFAFPPLIVHMTWADAVASRVETPSAIWRYAVVPGYVRRPGDGAGEHTRVHGHRWARHRNGREVGDHRPGRALRRRVRLFDGAHRCRSLSRPIDA